MIVKITKIQRYFKGIKTIFQRVHWNKICSKLLLEEMLALEFFLDHSGMSKLLLEEMLALEFFLDHSGMSKMDKKYQYVLG